MPRSVERQVVGWFRDLLGLPREAKGLLVSGGSMATLTALAVARHVRCGVNVRADGLRGAEQPFSFYLSAESHGCVRKAIELLGFGSASIRTIPIDDDDRMNVAALDAALAADRANHITPIAVVASAGTTNTGAIDDLAAIAGTCRRHQVWLHVDAAYGGPASWPTRMSIVFAHSLRPTASRWILTNGCSCRSKPASSSCATRRQCAPRSAWSRRTSRTDGSLTGVGGPIWFSEFGFQQTRGFRALKVWMAMKEFGLAGYKAAIEANVALAAYLADCVRASPELELMAPPGLSVVCFRVAGRNNDDESAIAAFNRTLLDRLQLGGEAFLSGTELRGRFTLRACIVNYRSTRQDIEAMLDAVRRSGVSSLMDAAPPFRAAPAAVGRPEGLRYERPPACSQRRQSPQRRSFRKASRIALRI